MKKIGVCVLGLLALASCHPAEKTSAKKSGGPVPVRVVAAQRQAVPLEVRTFGTVQALQSVDIRAQVGGPITELHFKEGQDVKAGDLIALLDPAELTAAKSALDAQVGALQATAASTRPELVARLRALDRVLRFGHYYVPARFSNSFRISYRAGKFAEPAVPPRYFQPESWIISTWWMK